MDEIDIVYVLGSGTKWQNNELRFSLRSLVKNLKGFRKIYVIGEKPDWIKNVIHIPFSDELLNNADGNIIRKVLRACEEEKLSEDFLFINDDHIFMTEMIAADIPPFQKGDMTTFPREFFEFNFWRGRLWRTRNILIEKGYSALHFDCHTPIVMNKVWFPQVMSQFDYARNIGYTMKSLYGNVVHPDAPFLNGEKVTVFRPYTMKDLVARTANRMFVSFNDDGLTPVLKEWLITSFPEQSKYEKHANIAATEVLQWLWDENRKYEDGISIFNKYGSSKRAKKFFDKGESKTRDMKLMHKMRELLNYI